MPSKSWPIHVYLMTLLEKSMTLGVTQMLQWPLGLSKMLQNSAGRYLAQKVVWPSFVDKLANWYLQKVNFILWKKSVKSW